MWCDNCLLVFPLRGGAIAWNVVIFLYSLAGGLFLLISGQYLFFYHPEWFIYGGVGMGVAAVALINMFALSNRSYTWSRVCHFLWPFIIVVCGIRGIIMIVQLGRYKEHIIWECQNGGQLWSDSSTPEAAAVNYDNTKYFPDAICAPGFSSLNIAFIFSLLIDIVFQMYAFFLNWRFKARLEKYSKMQGPFYGGYYG
ncbi:hypothetical protein BKA62DRAFT_705654 [Auriculariales sp. MPI-PUGE-AT-0066]|nr:hypothetical protein BKA62DRAFT_705654 [Auriculariales sp. MPI-PUGE-AT-0066]